MQRSVRVHGALVTMNSSGCPADSPMTGWFQPVLPKRGLNPPPAVSPAKVKSAKSADLWGDGLMGGWMDGWIDGWMGGWVNGYMGG